MASLRDFLTGIYWKIDNPSQAGRVTLYDINGNSQLMGVPIKNTYRASFIGAPVATLTFSLRGSATKTIKVTKIGFSQIGTTSTYIDLSIIKYSTIATGTASLPTMVALDSTNSTSTGLVQNWTVTPGTQTSVGVITSKKYLVPKLADNVVPELLQFDFGKGQRGTSNLILRGVSECIGINLSSLVAGSDANIFIEWTEE